MAWLISDRLYESWRCSQGQAADSSAGSCSAGKPSAPSKSNHTQRAYLSPDKMTAFSRLSRFGMTYEPLTEARGEELLTWFLAGFPARTSALPEKGRESKASDPACGWKWRESLAKYDPVSRGWKTRQHSVLGGLEPYSETWPRWGSMRDGELCPLPTLVLRTCENESGLWPTPTSIFNTANTGDKLLQRAKTCGAPSYLSEAVRWPTPRATDHKGAATYETAKGCLERGFSPNLCEAVQIEAHKEIFPTPQASDNRDRGGPQSGAIKRRIEKGKQISLSQTQVGALNPTWVEWLMNWPLNWTRLEKLPNDDFKHWEKTSTASVPDSGGRCVRSLWWEQDPSETPHRPQPSQQCAGQHRFALLGLSFRPAPDNKASQMRNLRGPVLSETQQEGGSLREQTMHERERTPVGRVAVGVVARIDRLKAIGNGQVPAVAATAWRLLGGE